MQRYVLTGGPGSGKSSIIVGLEMQGEYVVPEAAEDYILYRQSQGCHEPWLEEGFQDRILELQIQREARVPKEAERVFIDRGLPDGRAYYMQNKTEPSALMIQTMHQGLFCNNRYQGVFLVENHGSCKSTDKRRENLKEALELEGLLETVYTAMDYRPIHVKPGPLDERISTIMETVK
ncbi:MAG: AAA family ATPase [Nanobdellota archaeon]